jgi:hypothetical protein
MLHRPSELKEIAIFLSKSNNDANLFYSQEFIQKLAYVVDIFEKLSNLNKSMLGPQINTLTQNDEVEALMKKLELWENGM